MAARKRFSGKAAQLGEVLSKHATKRNFLQYPEEKTAVTNGQQIIQHALLVKDRVQSGVALCSLCPLYYRNEAEFIR